MRQQLVAKCAGTSCRKVHKCRINSVAVHKHLLRLHASKTRHPPPPLLPPDRDQRRKHQCAGQQDRDTVVHQQVSTVRVCLEHETQTEVAHVCVSAHVPRLCTLATGLALVCHCMHVRAWVAVQLHMRSESARIQLHNMPRGLQWAVWYQEVVVPSTQGCAAGWPQRTCCVACCLGRSTHRGSAFPPTSHVLPVRRGSQRPAATAR